MNFNVSGGTGALVVLMALWGIAVTIYWMVVAWRAMRAHERLASAAETLSQNQRPGGAI
jgi:uncharacterized membrane protein